MSSTSRSAHPRHSSRVDVRSAAHEERSRRTSELMAAAHELEGADRSALLDEVVLINRGVAEAIARRYRNRGVSEEDLEQVAYEGLIKAVNKFDSTVRPDLLTYAVPTIRGEVQRYFRDHSWMIRPTRNIQEAQWRINRSVERLSQELGRRPTDLEVGADVGCSDDTVREATTNQGCFTPTSLDRPVGPAEDMTLGSTLADATSNEVDAVEARVMLAPAMRDLGPRDRRILYMRFFEERTQSQIGEALGVTQMQVSRLLTRILGNLRKSIAA